MKHILFIGSVFLSLVAFIFSEAHTMELNVPQIARWYGNKSAAVSLRFDDALDSHVDFVIPKLNKHGIKATFMINPGVGQYRKNKEFWEIQVPKMGHELGNHTMHHRGAKTPEEADFEIGEVSRLIWELYPRRSKLLVFASGGGRVKWGGQDWKNAAREYKALVTKYFLTDLYDGHHPYLSARSGMGDDVVLRSVQEALRENAHQAIVFHDVGKANLIEYLKSIYRGYGLSFDRESFEKIVEFLDEKKDIIWTAPLGDILKYETERNAARLDLLSENSGHMRLRLTVATGAELYDHDLTLIIPQRKDRRVFSVFQGTRRIENSGESAGIFLVNVKPVSGPIEIQYQN